MTFEKQFFPLLTLTAIPLIAKVCQLPAAGAAVQACIPLMVQTFPVLLNNAMDFFWSELSWRVNNCRIIKRGINVFLRAR